MFGNLVKDNILKKTQAKLNETKELDNIDSVELNKCNRALVMKHKNLNVFGGCCRTDRCHIEGICNMYISVFKQLRCVDHDKFQSTESE